MACWAADFVSETIITENVILKRITANTRSQSVEDHLLDMVTSILIHNTFISFHKLLNESFIVNAAQHAKYD